MSCLSYTLTRINLLIFAFCFEIFEEQYKGLQLTKESQRLLKLIVYGICYALLSEQTLVALSCKGPKLPILLGTTILNYGLKISFLKQRNFHSWSNFAICQGVMPSLTSYEMHRKLTSYFDRRLIHSFTYFEIINSMNMRVKTC